MICLSHWLFRIQRIVLNIDVFFYLNDRKDVWYGILMASKKNMLRGRLLFQGLSFESTLDYLYRYAKKYFVFVASY